MSNPKIVVVVDGGLVQDVYLNDGEPADVLVVDLDTDGADEVHVFQDEDGDDFEAVAHFESAVEQVLGSALFQEALTSDVNDRRS
jgi:hypothetical protein